ncbi:MAG: hypothetical protein DHS20C02_10600 [Micavibrio sp.]|nr:MAG: hypothetical protein DHS20C02_10600 [Micavibrio sp.]
MLYNILHNREFIKGAALSLVLLLTPEYNSALGNEIKKEGVSEMADQKDHPLKAFVNEYPVFDENGDPLHMQRDVDETRVEEFFYIPNVKKLETGQVVKDHHRVNVNPVNPNPIYKEFSPDGQMLEMAYVKKGSTKSDGTVDPEDLYPPWKNGEDFDPRGADLVYYLPNTVLGDPVILGTAIDPLTHRVADVSPSGTPAKDKINKLFVNGREVGHAYVLPDRVEVGGDIKVADVYDPGEGFEYKENPKLFESIPASKPKVEKTPEPEKPYLGPKTNPDIEIMKTEPEEPETKFILATAPLSSNAFKAEIVGYQNPGDQAMGAVEYKRKILSESQNAFRDIRKLLKEDPRAESLETQNGIRGILGDDPGHENHVHRGYHDIIKTYLVESIAAGEPLPHNKYGMMMIRRRKGNWNLVEPSEAAVKSSKPSSESTPADVVVAEAEGAKAESTTLTQQFDQADGTAKFTSQMLPPDRSLYKDPLKYEVDLARSARKALRGIVKSYDPKQRASRRLPPDEIEKAVALFEQEDSGYGDILRAAKNDLDSKGHDPKVLSGYGPKIRKLTRINVENIRKEAKERKNDAALTQEKKQEAPKTVKEPAREDGKLDPEQEAVLVGLIEDGKFTEEQVQKFRELVLVEDDFKDASPEQKNLLTAVAGGLLSSALQKTKEKLEERLQKVKEAQEARAQAEQAQEDAWKGKLREAAPPGSEASEADIKESALKMLEVIKDFEDNQADLSVAARREQIAGAVGGWKEDHPTEWSILQRYFRIDSSEKAYRAAKESIGGVVGPQSKMELPVRMSTAAGEEGMIEAAFLEQPHVKTPFCPLTKEFAACAQDPAQKPDASVAQNEQTVVAQVSEVDVFKV